MQLPKNAEAAHSPRPLALPHFIVTVPIDLVL